MSSFLIDEFTWPWLFAMPVLFAAASLVLTMQSVDNSRERQHGRFDVVGSLLSAVAIGALVLGIHEGPERGWTDALALAGLVVGVLAALAFVAWELRHEHPLLEIRLFADRALATGSLTLLIVFAVMFGIFLVLVQYLQAVLGYSALQAAAGLLPMAAVMMPLSGVAPTIAKRVGTRSVLMTGIGLFGVGLAMLALMVSVEGGYWSVLPGLLVLGVGIGLTMSPSTTAITESLPHEKQGVASALNDTVRELGGAVGIALLGSLVNAGYRASVSPATSGLASDVAAEVEDGIGSAFAAAPRLGESAPSVIAAARGALVDGWRLSMWFGVGLAALAFAFVALRGCGALRSPRRRCSWSWSWRRPDACVHWRVWAPAEGRLRQLAEQPLVAKRNLRRSRRSGTGTRGRRTRASARRRSTAATGTSSRRGARPGAGAGRWPSARSGGGG